jgi:hypothetical protein
MIQFYNVKKKEKVEISEDRVERKTYEKVSKAGKLTIRYALAAIDEDGTKLTKFCSKDVYDSLG